MFAKAMALDRVFGDAPGPPRGMGPDEHEWIEGFGFRVLGYIIHVSGLHVYIG